MARPTTSISNVGGINFTENTYDTDTSSIEVDAPNVNDGRWLMSVGRAKGNPGNGVYINLRHTRTSRDGTASFEHIAELGADRRLSFSSSIIRELTDHLEEVRIAVQPADWFTNGIKGLDLKADQVSSDGRPESSKMINVLRRVRGITPGQ